MLAIQVATSSIFALGISAHGAMAQECELDLYFPDPPATASRLDPLVFEARTRNACAASLTIETVELRVAGPGSMTRPLYPGPELIMAPGDSAAKEIRLAIPPLATLGPYDLTVAIFRNA